eukprot:877311-Rhodomonas_salina.1
MSIPTGPYNAAHRAPARHSVCTLESRTRQAQSGAYFRSRFSRWGAAGRFWQVPYAARTVAEPGNWLDDDRTGTNCIRYPCTQPLRKLLPALQNDGNSNTNCIATHISVVDRAVCTPSPVRMIVLPVPGSEASTRGTRVPFFQPPTWVPQFVCRKYFNSIGPRGWYQWYLVFKPNNGCGSVASKMTTDPGYDATHMCLSGPKGLGLNPDGRYKELTSIFLKYFKIIKQVQAGA